MREYPLHLARAEFSRLVDRALAGEPQRVTRYGKEAVLIVSEADWNRRHKGAATLGALLADFVRETDFDETFDRAHLKQRRPLGDDFL